MIRLLEVTGNSDEAERYYRQATRLWPDNPKVQRGRVRGMVERGNYSAIERFAGRGAGRPDARRRHGESSRRRLAHAQPSAGRPRLQRQRPEAAYPVDVHEHIGGVGDLDGAFAIARSLYPSWQAPPGAGGRPGSGWIIPGGYDTEFLTGPAAKAMRTDPRFLGLARSEGLLEYWQKDGLPDFCTPPHPEAICKQLGARR